MADKTEQQFIPISFDGIKYVTNKSHLIVFGYIHEHQQKTMDIVIPSPIYFLCLMYYYIHDSFDPDKHSSHITITGDHNETIISEPSAPSYAICCAYGNHWMESMSNKLIKYKIKINAIEHWMDRESLYSLIGISSIDTCLDEAFDVGDNIFYALDSDGYKCWLDPEDGATAGKEYTGAWNKGDMITMELNFLKRTVSFYVNGEYKGIAFDDIKVGDKMKYKLAIACAKSGESYSIVDYSEE